MRLAILIEDSEQGADRPVGQALVTRQAENRADASALYRPRATFLAHLIATRLAVPQTRTLRRADPAVAVIAYKRTGM